MEMTAPESIPALPPDQDRAVRWLRSRDGERWSRARIGFDGRIASHDDDSGAFADVLRAPGPGTRARWPRPLSPWDLDA